MELLLQLGKLPAALIAQPPLELAVALSIAPVHNGAVGLGGPHGHIVLPLHQADIQLIAAQPARNGGAHNTRPNDTNVNQ